MINIKIKNNYICAKYCKSVSGKFPPKTKTRNYIGGGEKELGEKKVRVHIHLVQSIRLREVARVCGRAADATRVNDWGSQIGVVR